LKCRPRIASRKPVYLNGNPLNTYRRLYNGDRRCDQERIGRLYGDREDPAIFVSYLDCRSLTWILRAWRRIETRFAATSLITHGQTAIVRHCCVRSGPWVVIRETDREGLTLAGILMLGRWHVIIREFPNYFVQEWHPSGRHSRAQGSA
jgi:ATP-dependent DNA helicase RecG